MALYIREQFVKQISIEMDVEEKGRIMEEEKVMDLVKQIEEEEEEGQIEPVAATPIEIKNIMDSVDKKIGKEIIELRSQLMAEYQVKNIVDDEIKKLFEKVRRYVTNLFKTENSRWNFKLSDLRSEISDPLNRRINDVRTRIMTLSEFMIPHLDESEIRFKQLYDELKKTNDDLARTKRLLNSLKHLWEEKMLVSQ